MPELRFSDNASMRFRQRGIRAEVLSCIEKHGDAKKEEGGVTRIYLSKSNAKQAVKDLKKVIREIEHAGGVSVLIDDVNVISGCRKNNN